MVTPAPVGGRPSSRVLPPNPLRSALLMLLFTGMLYLVEGADMVTGGLLDREGGIVPRDTDQLDGVLFSPLLHAGWLHLESNTLPFLVFGFLAMAGGLRQFAMVTVIIWLLGGLGVWLIAEDGSITIGASGVIFGWLTFLLVRGFYARSGKQIALAAVLFFFWGGVLWGVLPLAPDVSWQAHLCGALSGILAARLVIGRERRRRSAGPPAGGYDGRGDYGGPAGGYGGGPGGYGTPGGYGGPVTPR